MLFLLVTILKEIKLKTQKTFGNTKNRNRKIRMAHSPINEIPKKSANNNKSVDSDSYLRKLICSSDMLLGC